MIPKCGVINMQSKRYAVIVTLKSACKGNDYV